MPVIPGSKIIDNVRGEIGKRQWIIFDGDVDPEWVENLNSLLDLTKLLTLPNGERLSLPPNVRIMFEVSGGGEKTLHWLAFCRVGVISGARQCPVVQMGRESGTRSYSANL